MLLLVAVIFAAVPLVELVIDPTASTSVAERVTEPVLVLKLVTPDAGSVQLDPRVHVAPFTVVEGDEASTTLPVPVVGRSPSTPELSYKMYPEVPPDTAAVPTVMPE